MGICTWSLDREDIANAVSIAAEIGITDVQIGFFTPDSLRAADGAVLSDLNRQHGIKVHGVFIAFEGEDYATDESLARTGGLLPDERFAERMELIRSGVKLAGEIASPNVLIHAGTVPADHADERFHKLVARLQETVTLLADGGINLLLETGREPADALRALVERVGSRRLAVNYDPANFLVFGTGEPIDCLRALKAHIAGVHLKDAHRRDDAAGGRGSSALLGSGDAAIPRLVNKLRAWGYAHPLFVECSRGQGGRDVVASAVEYVKTML
ncbi:MAG: sugar phosphate isomerase/epimerase family protein [Planctomycetota bacterium]